MSKVKNVSGSDRQLGGEYGGRLVVADAVLEVAEEAVYGFTCQTENWAPADKATQKVHDAEHAAQEERNKANLPDEAEAVVEEAGDTTTSGNDEKENG